MGTVPTGRMEREMRKYYLQWVKELPDHTSTPKALEAHVETFKASIQGLAETIGADVARLGVDPGFPAPKMLDLSPHLGTVYEEIDKATIRAAISIGLNARDTAQAIMSHTVNKEYYKVERLARTETVSAYWKNQWDEVKGLDLVMVWSVERGPRTCEVCIAKDGLVVPEESIRDHPNGRCTLLPVLPSEIKYKGTLQPDGSVAHNDDWKPKEPEPVKVPVSKEDARAYDDWVKSVVKEENFIGVKLGGKAPAARLRAMGKSDTPNFDDLYILRPHQRADALEAWQRSRGLPITPRAVPKATASKPVAKAAAKKTVPKAAPRTAPVSRRTAPVKKAAPKTSGVTKLTADQKEVLSKYTENSFSFNNHLRTGKAIAQGPLDVADVKALDNIMDSVRISSPTRVRRVIPMQDADDIIRTARSGGVYKDKAFMSTQKISHGDIWDMVDDYAQGDDALVLEINLPKGTPALDMTKFMKDDAFFYDEGEVLIPRGMEFKTSRPIEDEEGIWKIILTPIL